MYRIVNTQGETVAIATRMEDAKAMIQTLNHEQQLKIVVDKAQD